MAATRAYKTWWGRRAIAETARFGAQAADRYSGRHLCQAEGRAVHVPAPGPGVYPIADDQQFAYELLAEAKVLIVQGTGFNWIAPDHFRVVFLPNSDDLTEAMGRIARFLEGYRKRHSRG